MGKLKITGIIPTFNNEDKVEAALKSLDFCDELIVVDSYSTDNTIEIAKKYNATIIQHEYVNSATQKNWIIPQAKYDWIVLLDSDEWFNDDLKNEVIETFKNGPKYDAYWMRRDNYFMGRRMHYSGIQGDKVVRLFQKTHRYQDKHVHSEIITDNLNVTFLKYHIQHDTYVSLAFHIQKLNRYAVWQANDYDSRTRNIGLFHLFFKPSFRFIKHYFIGRGFLDGVPGFTYSILQSYAVGMRYTMMWLKRRNLN